MLVLYYTIIIKPKSSNKSQSDRKRYKSSRRRKKIVQIRDKILNLSSFKLDDEMVLVLGKGFGFCPVPDASRLKQQEWHSAMRHIRTAEWADIFSGESDSDNPTKLPKKLKVEKFNRPNQSDVSERQRAYSEAVTTGMRCFDEWCHVEVNNLTGAEKKALKKLEGLCNDKIMIGHLTRTPKLL